MINTGIFGNHDQDITTETGGFYVCQRNVGFADNDGHWLVTQAADLYWAPGGYLTRRRDSRFLGDFATTAEAEAAINAAGRMPELSPHVTLSGRDGAAYGIEH